MSCHLLPRHVTSYSLSCDLICAVYRTDPARTQYTGALCGLGWDENTGGPALPDHDIEIAFDVKFDVEDLSMVSARPGQAASQR